MKNLQVFSNRHKNFTFFDFDWEKIVKSVDPSERQKAGIHFNKSNGIYLWECGFSQSAEIIEAYLTFGEEFPAHYKAVDSSFVLYDEKNEIAVAARDLIGVFPLYYYKFDNGCRFIFSFSINALLDSELFTPRVNNAKVIEYINFKIQEPPDNQTFYENLKRVLPAYHLKIHDGQSAACERYGQLDLTEYSSYDDGQFVRKFRELFVQSVKKSIDFYPKIAATLSGGLDSSSVCCVAQSMKSEPLQTFNFNTETSGAQEDEYIRAVEEKCKVRHRTVKSQFSEYEAIIEIIAQNAQPHFVFNHTIQLDLINAAKEAGCEVFLSGHWGDQVVSHGLQYLDELFAAEDWKNLKTALDQHFENTMYINRSDDPNISDNSLDPAKLYIFQHLTAKLRKEKKWLDLPKTVLILIRDFDCGLKDFAGFVRQKYTRRERAAPPKLKNIIRPEFKAESGKIKSETGFIKLDIAGIANTPLNSAQKRQLEGFFKSSQIYGQEEFFEIYRKNSLKSAHPFYDAELLALNLCVPLRLKFGEGKKRGTLRLAMKDFLPEKVANRVTKGEFSEYHEKKLISLIKDFNGKTNAGHKIWQIIDKSVFDENAGYLLSGKYNLNDMRFHMVAVMRTIILAIWLDYFEENYGKTLQ